MGIGNGVDEAKGEDAEGGEGGSQHVDGDVDEVEVRGVVAVSRRRMCALLGRSGDD